MNERIFPEVGGGPREGGRWKEPEKECFGDEWVKKREDRCRVACQNINNLPLWRTAFKNHIIMNQVKGADGADIRLWQEIGLSWSEVPPSQQWRQRVGSLREVSTFACNTKETTFGPTQAGGTAIVGGGRMIPRCKGKGVDDSGLGRWAWMRLQGKNGRIITMVSVYCPCRPSTPGPGTVYEQHRRAFGINDKEPRTAFWEDLQAFLSREKDLDHWLLVGGDFNADTRSREVREFFRQLNMENVITRVHGSTGPATFVWNNSRTPIDAIFGSMGILPVACGYAPYGEGCPSDHRLLWAEFDWKELFAMPREGPRPLITKLNAADPRQWKHITGKPFSNWKRLCSGPWYIWALLHPKTSPWTINRNSMSY